MYYTDSGEGEVVVLLHGFLENGKMWNEFAQELTKKYRVIIPDLLGHGQTPAVAESHTMEMQAEHVIKILNDLHIDQANFVGHSMGGYISLAIARDYAEKVKRLCLFFSSSLPDSSDKKEQRLKAVEVAQENTESFIRHGVRNLFNPNKLEDYREEIEQARSWGMETPLEGIQAALRGMRERADTTAVLQNASYPIEIILGAYDPAVDATAFQKYIPAKENIQVDVLEVGHMGHLEAPAQSLSLIQAFLKS